MKKFFVSTFIGFGLGLGIGVSVMGFENLKIHLWDRYQKHLARPSIQDVRTQKQGANYIQKFTAKVRKKSPDTQGKKTQKSNTQVKKALTKTQSKAVSKKKQKRSKSNLKPQVLTF
jgi:hypothetical protein